MKTLLGAPAALGLLSACATVTQGSTDTVAVDTAPQGAVCTVRRDGATIGFVAPTPGVVAVPKSRKALALDCEKNGFLPAAGVLSSELEAMTFGNVLIGGVIGVAVDASSGALNRYPSSVRIVLTPERFGDAAARDAFFAGRRSEIDGAHVAAIEKIDGQCGVDEDECARRRRIAEKARDQALARLEADRAQTVIDG